MFEDTIVAIATPLGEGGLALVRLSGREAIAVAQRGFAARGKAPIQLAEAESHTVHYGHIVRDDRVVDEVLITVMKAPRTFTREDVVEISCHGGVLAARMVLETVLRNGARLANPGEFTRRAFLNGRIDLTQAEAVADLIHARTELAIAAAQQQLAGKLSERINALRDELLASLAHVEAHIDFPEDDIAPADQGQILARLKAGMELADALLSTADEGRILRNGIRAAIVGRPNAGKSSLLNLLLGHDRAIVSTIPGTTRDTIEEAANIGGVPVVLVDTAGLRHSTDELEREGVRRSRSSIAAAELIVHVFDGSGVLDAADEEFLEEFSHKKRVLVRNKVDLPVRLAMPTAVDAEMVDVSCLTGHGLEKLKKAMICAVWADASEPQNLHVTINSRHQDALRRARAGLEQAAAALAEGASLEFVALDLRLAVNAVGEIVGKTATEDLLDAIFSKFCIGK